MDDPAGYVIQYITEGCRSGYRRAALSHVKAEISPTLDISLKHQLLVC
jgi:hypothetical protein